ncbi:MAG TPA: hypothetical protein VJL59_14190 [Anaerolineales bacterium]|nr:hypothetical protein [Anaerolineales bacterium]HLB48153.1 hypothetical protein [Anaerolineales bacterium]
MSTSDKTNGFDDWCIVELFGHVTLAGRVTEQTIGGCSFIRLDVPEVNGQEAFTKLLGNGAIYSITPVSEEVVTNAITHLRARPVTVYALPQPLATTNSYSDEDDEDGDSAF